MQYNMMDLSEYHPFNFNENMSRIKRIVHCRDKEIMDILSLLGQTPMDEPAPAIFVYGDMGTGKTLLLKKCLKYGKFHHAIVNCLEAYSMRVIYEDILNQLTDHEMGFENTFRPHQKCHTFYDFIMELKSICSVLRVGKQFGKNFSVILALDKAEELKKYGREILPSFLKLREITNLKISVIFISVLPWSSFYGYDNAFQPVTYYLNHYSQKQVREILQLDRPQEFTERFYRRYIHIFLSIFYHACHDMRELKYQAWSIFRKYSEPIRRGELTEKDMGELWKRSQSFFKKSLNSLFLKVDDNVESMEMCTAAAGQEFCLELPYYSKYILVASYIASYNPPKEDKKLFVKNHGKIRKSKVRCQSVRYHTLGPKSFGLQRLLAIVSCLLDGDHLECNAQMHIEIATLVSMNLLTQVSDDILDGPTFKCNVSLQFIESVSRNLQFPIRKYLVDFMQ